MNSTLARKLKPGTLLRHGRWRAIFRFVKFQGHRIITVVVHPGRMPLYRNKKAGEVMQFAIESYHCNYLNVYQGKKYRSITDGDVPRTSLRPASEYMKEFDCDKEL